MTVTVRSRQLARLLTVLALLLLGIPILSTPARAAAVVSPSANPNLDPRCGIDVALVIDRSGSISTNNVNVRNAAQALVNALVGSGSKVQTVSFAQTATAEPGNNANISALSFLDPAGLTIPLFASSGTTNWDDGLEMTRRSPGGIAPLTFVITDGDPTQRNTTQPDGHGLGTSGTGSSTSQADLDQAVYEANVLKAHPSHMFVVGVGAALGNAASEQRIKDISGPDKLTFDASGTPNIPFGTADYTLVTQFSSLQSTFAHFVRELCGPGLNVVKKLQLSNGQTATADGSTPFSFTAAVTPTLGSWQNPSPNAGGSGSLASGSNGAANFKWEPVPTTATSQVTLSEAAKTGWVFNGEKCVRNTLDGTLPTVILDNVGPNAVGASKPSSFAIPNGVGPDENVSCEVFNRQVRTSTVSVDKVTSPAGRPETFAFHLNQGGNIVGTLAGIADATPPATFSPVLPGTYSVTEDVAPHYSATGATCDNLATTPVETAPPANLVVAEQQAWRCTFTNTADNGTITIVKHVVNAPGGAFDFTSNIPNHGGFNLTPANGQDASASFDVVPLAAGTYSVTETNPTPFSPAGASCSDGSPNTALSISPGEHVTCTFTNNAPAPTIVVTKTPVVNAVPEPGADVLYTVTIMNTSAAPVQLVQLGDSIPGGTLNVFTQPGTCAAATGATIAIGATLSCTFTAPVTGDAFQVIHDTVTAKVNDGFGRDATGAAQAAVTITDVKPTITMSKSANPTQVPEPGGTVTYTVAVTNLADEAVTLTDLTDAVSGGAPFDVTTVGAPVTATTCGLAPIAAHATYTCTFMLPVLGNAGTTAGTLVPDTAAARAVDNDGSAATANASAAVRITDMKPTLDITKTASTSSVNEPGATVTYTVDIHNTSVEPVTITSISDRVGSGPSVDVTTIPGNTCTAKLGQFLAAGASTSCAFPQSVSGNANTSVTDTVTVHGHDDEQNDAMATAVATVNIKDVKPTVEVSKAASVASVPEPGGPVTYSVNVKNTSVEPVVITAVTDVVGGGAPFDTTTLPGSTCGTLIGATLTPQQTATCNFPLAVAGDANDNVVDTATVVAHDDEGNSVDGKAQATVKVTDVKPTIEVTKNASVGSVPEPGGDVLYTVAVHNTSVEPVSLTAITDSVSGGATFPVTGVAGTTCALPQTIAAGASYSCTFAQHVAGDAGATVPDTVKATAHDNDGNTVDGTASASIGVIDVLPSITVTKVAASTSVPEPGADVPYTVTVHNTSVEPVTITALSDSVAGVGSFDVTGIPGTTCSVPQVLAVGGSYTCTFTMHITGDAHAVVTDTVFATGHDNENNQTIGHGSESVNVTDVNPSMTVSKTASTTSVPEPGGNVTYSVAVHNTSVEPLTLTSLTDKVGTGSAFDVTGVAGTTCSLPQTIATGATYSCTFAQHVSGDAGSVVTDTVTAKAHDNEDNEVSGEGTESVTITDVPPTGTVTKTAGSESVPEPGAPVVFNVLVHNTSVEPVHITALTDSVAAGPAIDVTKLVLPITATTCTDAIGHELAVGGDYTCAFTMAVVGNANSSVTDVVSATLVDNERGSTTPHDDSTVRVTDVKPTIAVTKTTTAGTVDAPGGLVPFTVTVTNLSPEPVTVDSITDALSVGSPINVTKIALPITATDCATGGVLAAVGQPGNSLTCHFTMVVAAPDAATFPDTVKVTAHDDEQNQASAESSATAKVTPVADLAIVKSVSQALTAGGTGAYTLSVRNNGPSNATAVVVTDNLPEGVTATAASGTGWQCSISADARTVVCARSTLAAGASEPIQVSVAVASTLGSQSVTNVSTVGSSTKDSDPSNNRSTVTSPVAAVAVLPLVLARTGYHIGLWALGAGALMLLGLVIRYSTEVLPERRK